MEKERILRQAQNILAEINQIFLDAEHWNNNHPDEKPINPDEDGFLHHMAEILVGVLTRNNHA